MKFETFLPVFPGFYGTIFDGDGDLENFLYSEEVDFDDLKIDYDQYHKDVVIDICSFVEDNCPFINKVELENIVSPKFYNFSNDSANVTIDVDIKGLKEWIEQNYEYVEESIYENYTSRSGFISYHSNEIEEWKEETDNFTNFSEEPHKLGAILNMYFDLEFEQDSPQLAAYYEKETSLHGYVEIIHYNVKDLEPWNQQEVAMKVIDDVEPFGYLEIVFKEAKKKAEITGEDWRDIASKEAPLEILSQAGVKKVNAELETIND